MLVEQAVPKVDLSDEERWQAVMTRDATARGVFVYGVASTGVYCRPGCASRLPRKQNVQYFDDWEAAEQAGFRACKRCQPRRAEAPNDQTQAIVHACQIIDAAVDAPLLADLARSVGLSPYYFHRLFKKVVGVTPKQYYQQKRLERVRAHLDQGASVTDAMLNAGFQSSSRFYDETPGGLGMRPSEYRKGGEGLSIRYATARSSLGWVLIGATLTGICTIEFGDDPALLEKNLHTRFAEARLEGNDPEFAAWVMEVLAFLEEPKRGLNLPLDVQGTAFQRRVWMALREIPAGETISYAEVARRIGNPRATRAVAHAIASNKIAVAIPCHRVVRNDGGLGGYRWGIERKRQLLQKESEKG